MRKEGTTYKDIGKVLDVCTSRAREMAQQAERRFNAASKVYAGRVTDPIVYGVWHTFSFDEYTSEPHREELR